MMWVRIEDVGDNEFPIDGKTDKFSSMRRTSGREIQRAFDTDSLSALAA